MRANEIIRGVLDLLNRIECGLPMPASQPTSTTINMTVTPQEPQAPVEVSPVITAVEPEVVDVEDEETRRFKQIMDLLVPKSAMYSNSPSETIAGIDSVTTDAGGGLNGPKNPSDLRAANSFSMYPNFQAKGNE